MADTIPPPASELGYKPLSILAVLGFALAALFALIVLIGGVVSVIKGAPLELTSWLYFLPVGGAVLCWLGQNEIQRSEGTRAGWQLTRWGLGLCLCGGLGFFMYSYFTGLALTQQANAFLTQVSQDQQGQSIPESGFFPRLEAGRTDPAAFNAAFLLTVPAPSRGTTRPDQLDAFRLNFDQNRPDGTPGALGQFRGQLLVRMFNPGPGDAIQIEPLGVQLWTYEQKSYLVKRLYRITNTEGASDLLLPVRSSEALAEGENRKWFVSLREAELSNVKISPWGMTMRQARNQVKDWLQELIERPGPDNFLELDKTAWDKVALKEQLRKHLKTQVAELFLHAAGFERQRLNLGDNTLCPWEKIDDRIRIHQPIKAIIKPAESWPAYQLEGFIQVESLSPLTDAALPKMEWKVAAIDFQRSTAIVKGGPPTK